MYLFLTVVHIVTCLFLTVVVLLQSGKGADAGAVFGGSSQTIFGSSGAGNFLTKLTTAMAVVFMITSLALTYGAAQRVGQSIFDDVSPPASTSTPAVQPSTGQPGAGQEGATPATQGQAPASGTAPAASGPAATSQAAPAQPSAPPPPASAAAQSTAPTPTPAAPESTVPPPDSPAQQGRQAPASSQPAGK
jgi:preprotein translocase subunit SecG